jgi:hypothetical protein
MSASRYRFHGTWRLPAEPRAVFAALAALDSYPAWWPQVRCAQPRDVDTCAITIRSVLPLTLRFEAHRQRRDDAAGVLQAGLTGDLVGYSRWTVVPQAVGSAALFEEHVELRHPVAGRLPVLRPALVANHAVMMRRGEAGLRAWLGRAGS